MRLFVAINLNDEMKDALVDMQHIMRANGVRGRETPAENMHLTLAFIGDYDDPEFVKTILGKIEVGCFEMKLGGIGAFGDLWWAGVEESGPLQDVAGRLRNALAEAGIPYDRKKFTPHITLIRRAKGRLTDASTGALADCFGASMMVDHISLMRSDRGENGTVYTEL